MPVQILDVMDGANARMVQLRSGSSFQHEAVEGLGVVEQAVGNELQGNVAAQPRIDRVAHHSHSSTTKLPHDTIVRNYLADHPQGRGFHLAVMLGCVRSPVNSRHPRHPSRPPASTWCMVSTDLVPGGGLNPHNPFGSADFKTEPHKSK